MLQQLPENKDCHPVWSIPSLGSHFDTRGGTYQDLRSPTGLSQTLSSYIILLVPYVVYKGIVSLGSRPCYERTRIIPRRGLVSLQEAALKG